MPDNTRNLLHAGAAILGVAFLVKAAMWPLGFWLPRTYDAAAPPVAAMFTIMTKLGIYILLRLSLLLFGDQAGPSAGFGDVWLICGGAATLVVGMIGMLAAKDLGRIAGYSLLVSAGTLLGAIGFGDPAVIGGALFYLVASSLGTAAFFLLAGLIAPEGDDELDDPQILEAYNPTDAPLFAEEDETVVVISAPAAVLSAAFLACTLLIAGLPPTAGLPRQVRHAGPDDRPARPAARAGRRNGAVRPGHPLEPLRADRHAPRRHPDLLGRSRPHVSNHPRRGTGARAGAARALPCLDRRR